MPEVFVARQPIFNRDLQVAGYELLFRGGDASEALVADSEGATASVVLNSFTEIGLERIVGCKPAWVNVSREFVLSGLAATMPPSVVGLEILEDELLDERFVHALIDLKRQGYRLALDDFQYSVSAERVLALVDVVKLDVLELGRDGLAREVARLKPYGMTLLAEKVETARRSCLLRRARLSTCSRASSSAAPSSCTTAASSPTAPRSSRCWPRSRTRPSSSASSST